MADQTSLPEPGVTRLEPLPKDWLRTRRPSYWLWQFLAYLPAVLIDWVLSTVDNGAGGGVLSRSDSWLLLALYVVAYLPLLVRRRWPVVTFAVVLIVALVFTATGAGQPFLGLLIALHAVTALLPLAWSQAALFLALVPGLAQSYFTYLSFSEGKLIDFLLPATFFTGLTIAVWLFGRHEHAQRLAALRLRVQVERSESVATDRERRRIAHELHDILSHSVSAMMMQAAGARALAQTTHLENPEIVQLDTVQKALTTIEETGSQSLRELHRLLGALRDTDDDHSRGTNEDQAEGRRRAPLPLPDHSATFDPEGVEAPSHLNLHQLITSATRSGLSVELHHIGEHRPMDPSVNTAAYRVTQESLTNALKHGGRGAVVDIYETWQDDQLRLQIRSRPGHSATTEAQARPPGSGTGLLGLRERVELAGGTFEYGWAGDDFITTAVLPLTGTPSPRWEEDR